MVRVDRVTKRFGDITAVDQVGFSVPRGEFLTILGPSGCGKTTLLQMVAGFLHVDEGEILIHGRAMSDVPPHRRSIGMVFQKLALFPHMTAAENVAYPLKMRRFPPRRIPELVDRYLQIVRLGGYGTRRIQELSGGQQQRVAIARALVFEPDLLLLDEPLAALDRKLREDMQLEFRRIQQELGVTTINVTHDQREALIMSDRVMVMDQGRCQQLARPIDTYRSPANRFVAGFIGVTNFVPSTIVRVSHGAATIRIADTEMPARLVDDVDGLEGRPADGAIRAEQIRIGAAPGATEDLECRFQAVVVEVIFEGDRLVYGVSVPGLGDLELRVFDHDPSALSAHAAGQTVQIGWNARDLTVFPH